MSSLLPLICQHARQFSDYNAPRPRRRGGEAAAGGGQETGGGGVLAVRTQSQRHHGDEAAVIDGGRNTQREELNCHGRFRQCGPRDSHQLFDEIQPMGRKLFVVSHPCFLPDSIPKGIVCHQINPSMVAAAPARYPVLLNPIGFVHRSRPSSSSSSALRLRRISTSSFACSTSASPLAPVASMDAPPQGYRTNVGICLADPSLTKIFSASRLHIPGSWQMPQGGIDEGEDPRAAAFRELREETGVTSAEVVAEAPNWLTYDFPPQVREKLSARWGTDWKGQAQKWFLFRFTGKDDEINLNGDGSEKPEFGEWTWMTPQQVIEKAVDFKKPVYEEALKHFAPYLNTDPTASS